MASQRNPQEIRCGVIYILIIMIYLLGVGLTYYFALRLNKLDPSRGIEKYYTCSMEQTNKLIATLWPLLLSFGLIIALFYYLIFLPIYTIFEFIFTRIENVNRK